MNTANATVLSVSLAGETLSLNCNVPFYLSNETITVSAVYACALFFKVELESYSNPKNSIHYCRTKKKINYFSMNCFIVEFSQIITGISFFFGHEKYSVDFDLNE